VKTTGRPRLVTSLAVIALAAGVATSGFAVLQIHQMAQNSQSLYLPETSLSWSENSLTSGARKSGIRKGSFIGIISIPSINKSINVFEGTSSKELAKGVGHFIGSVMPGVADNSVLAGHRDTVFSNLGKVKIGALVDITIKRTKFTYKVNRIRIVDKDDRTVIVPMDSAMLTLSTCYPFRYFGNAPDRYIVIAKLIGNSKVT
jgi:sortase A